MYTTEELIRASPVTRSVTTHLEECAVYKAARGLCNPILAVAVLLGPFSNLGHGAPSDRHHPGVE
jgi:hypothetical protein